jgi:hypothetical protein
MSRLNRHLSICSRLSPILPFVARVAIYFTDVLSRYCLLDLALSLIVIRYSRHRMTYGGGWMPKTVSQNGVDRVGWQLKNLFQAQQGVYKEESADNSLLHMFRMDWGMHYREPGTKGRGFFVRDAEGDKQYFRSIFYRNDRIYTDLRSRSPCLRLSFSGTQLNGFLSTQYPNILVSKCASLLWITPCKMTWNW